VYFTVALVSSSNTSSEGATSPGGLSTTVSRSCVQSMGLLADSLADVLSAALDSGVAISILVVFFWYVACYPRHPFNPNRFFQLAIPQTWNCGFSCIKLRLAS